MVSTPFAAVVLAGGAARRFSAPDKPGHPVGGQPMIARVLDAVAGARPRVVVGPQRWALPPDIHWAWENPPGGGPLAATGAGIAAVVASADPPRYTALLAADLPFLTPAAVQTLLHRAEEAAADGALYLDDAGHHQLLCGVWRTSAVVRRLTAIGGLTGVPMRALLAGLIVTEVHASSGTGPPWFDCDTDEDLQNAEEWWR